MYFIRVEFSTDLQLYIASSELILNPLAAPRFEPYSYHQIPTISTSIINIYQIHCVPYFQTNRKKYLKLLAFLKRLTSILNDLHLHLNFLQLLRKILHKYHIFASLSKQRHIFHKNNELASIAYFIHVSIKLFSNISFCFIWHKVSYCHRIFIIKNDRIHFDNRFFKNI